MTWTRRAAKGLTLALFLLTFVSGSLFLTSSFMLSSTVPLDDAAGTAEAMVWVNAHWGNGSALIVHFSYLSWAKLYLDKKYVIVYYVTDIESALNLALKRPFDPIFLLRWRDNTVPNNFVFVFQSGRTLVFKYNNLSQA